MMKAGGGYFWKECVKNVIDIVDGGLCVSFLLILEF